MHVVVKRNLVLAGSTACDPSAIWSDRDPRSPDQLHGRRGCDHVPRLMHPIQATQCDPTSTPFAPGKLISVILSPFPS